MAIPVPRRNIFCVGRNYRAHAKELAGSVFKAEEKKDDGWPMVFTKPPELVIAPGAAIRIPRGVSEDIDYEAELALVIGRGGINIPRERVASSAEATVASKRATQRDKLRQGFAVHRAAGLPLRPSRHRTPHSATRRQYPVKIPEALSPT